MQRRIVEKVTFNIPKQPKLLRVAAYARVSTGKDAMLHSLSAQVSYYSKLIQNHVGWQYCGVYADEAVTGTKESREQFDILIKKCKAGEIDLIITKSISRFARNTVTLLETVRELKALGVDIYFEEQHIHTLSAEGELMLTILASYAQEESRSASENQKWRIRKGFENGELINLRFIYGYKIVKGVIVINPDEAEIVREIFERIASGDAMNVIARDLNKRKITGIWGGEWNVKRIRDIAKNEKYLGNALLQKTYRNNHLEKKKTINRGELPMYYAEGTHDAIITQELFNSVQAIITATHKEYEKSKKPEFSLFTGFVRCEKCGKNYKRSGSEKRRYWNCSTYLNKGKAYCREPKINESILYAVTSEILHENVLTVERLHKRLTHIGAYDNTLVFYFTDGHKETRTWQNTSRANSWTPEMKEIARERAVKQRRQ